MLSEKVRAKNDISCLVDAVDISECGGDGEHGADLGQGFVDFVHLLLKVGMRSS